MAWAPGLGKASAYSRDHNSVQGKRDTVASLAGDLGIITDAYTLPAGTMILPGDVQDLSARMARRAAILQEPGLVVPMVLAKFGPHRAILEEVYEQHRGSKETERRSLFWVCRRSWLSVHTGPVAVWSRSRNPPRAHRKPTLP